MTKRACPFENHICRQTKTHLSDYENDLNVIKDIQEQTLRKLMNGSRKLYSNNILKNDCEIKAWSPHENVSNNKKFIQKCVTNYLMGSRKLNNNASTSIMHLGNSQSKCSFCDESSNLLHKCIICLESYCSSCCFTNYESEEENRICMSCS